MTAAIERPARTLKPLHWSELEERDRPPYLVKGVLNDGRFSVVYGEPGAMKTFVALDLALHVALDRPWHGQRVKGGAVVYVACEGGGSIEDRLAAFCRHHGVERSAAPFYVLPETVNLGDKKADLLPLTEAVKAIEGVRLIIIDTLSRALFGGNENAPDDMGEFVACCDALRRKTGAHVLVIHHTGKDVERGARGHSSLKAAADTELVVTKADGVCLVRATKQRDLAEGFEIGFRWKPVEIGEDEDGDKIASLVLEPTEERPGPDARLPKGARDALDVLWRAIKVEGIAGGPEPAPPVDPKLHAIREKRWRELCAGVPLSRGGDRAVRQAFTRAKDRLIEAGVIGEGGGYVWPWPGERDAQVEAPF